MVDLDTSTRPPEVVYRYLPTKHVADFLAGRLLLSTLDWCRKKATAGINADSTEGMERYERGHYDPATATPASRKAQQRHLSGVFATPAEERMSGILSIPATVEGYVFSTSLLRKDSGLHNVYGPKCIRIVQPVAVAQLILNALTAQCPGVSDAQFGPVVYGGRSFTDDEGIDAPPGFHSLEKFRFEHEWRVLFRVLDSRKLERLPLEVPQLARYFSIA